MTKICVLPERLVFYRRERNPIAAVSSPTQKNNLRLANETYFLFREFFERMPAALFQEAFEDRLRGERENKTPEEINTQTAEKFFVLYDFPLTGISNHQPAFEYLMDHRHDEGLLETLENDFGFSMNDFYDITAEKFTIY